MRAAPGLAEVRLDGSPALGLLERTVDDTAVQPFGCLAFHLRFTRGSHGNSRTVNFYAGKPDPWRRRKEEREEEGKGERRKERRGISGDSGSR